MDKAKFIQRNLTSLQSIAKEMKDNGFSHIDFDTAKYGELHLNLFNKDNIEQI